MDSVTLPKDFVQLLIGCFISSAHEHSRSTKEASTELRRHMTEAKIPAHLQETLIFWGVQEVGE